MRGQSQRYTCFCAGAVALAIGCNHPTDVVEGTRVSAIDSALTRPKAPSPVLSVASPYAVDNSMPGIREPHVTKGSEVTELLADSTSAYHAELAVDDDAVYLLTDNVAYRIVPGSNPQQVELANGSTAAVARSGYVYWKRGSVWRVPKVGGAARRLAVLEHQPQFLMAAGDDVAWLDMPLRDQFLIQTANSGRVRTLLSYSGRIETATLSEGRVFFVRRDDVTSWRIGSVSVRGGEPIYAASKSGPHPAKLAVAGDIYYYDVSSNEVHQLSADLTREVTLTHDFVCSPIAASVRLYCPNMDGMFELARHAGARLMPLFPSPARITAVAASSRFLVWLTDTGPGKLSLKMIRLAVDDDH